MFLKILNNLNFINNWILPFSVTLSITLLVIYLINYYRRVFSYPRGPFPLPVLGNVLLFRGSKTDSPIITKLTAIGKTFGPIYTLWIGSTPLVVVNNYELQCEASVQKRNDFVYRPDNKLYAILKGGTENIFATSGPYWEALRKVGIFAVRQFQSGDKLPQFVNEVTSQAVELMLKSKQPIDPIVYGYFIIINTIALISFGKKFDSLDNPEYNDIKKWNNEFIDLFGNGLMTDFIPWLKPWYYKREKQIQENLRLSLNITKNTFIEHKKTFKSGIIRDFADCVIEAKEEAIRENYSRNKYLNNENLFVVVNDLLIAATDTTQTALRWSLLLLANDSQLQQKIYKEINDNIGDRMPVQDDKTVLPFTSAFIMEVLRFRPSVPVGLDHSNANESALGGYKIPKNTSIIFNLFAQNNDPEYWSKPEVFNPNRFIDENGKLITGRLPSYVTFGSGPRTCIGERLALNNLQLIIVNLLQRVRVELVSGENTADFQPQNYMLSLLPRDYQIVCHKRQ